MRPLRLSHTAEEKNGLSLYCCRISQNRNVVSKRPYPVSCRANPSRSAPSFLGTNNLELVWGTFCSSNT